MQEGQSKSKCIYKITTIFRRTKVKVDCQLRDYVQFFISSSNLAILHKGANNEINRTHKRALRALYGDYESTFEDLLDRDKSKTIHKKNLDILMTEVYRTINPLNPEHMWEFFTKRDVPHGLRISELCKIPSVNTQCNGINSLSFRGSLLWNALSDEIKLTTSAKSFKKEIRHWDGKNCTCHICI